MDYLSLGVSVFSVFIGIYALAIARKESRQSASNYTLTKELLGEIKAKADLIDRAIQLQLAQLVAIINKALDTLGYQRIEYSGLSLEDIERIFIEKIEPTNQQVKEIKKNIDSAPRIFSGSEPPVNPQTGDIWFKTKL